ncbi:hypothetical protein HOLleu_44196 [Holothuria leucospilota]|uniref:Uncharacterized protein n=1 Tax=Holothuria leucospilota TaxID=206669 RepID=A0A9Q1B9F5_HOLLE|nr:hypothetical protein HOLleu_44196 [Holothuria leucospilota]
MQCYRLENNDTQSSNCCTVTTSGYLSKQTAFGQDWTQRNLKQPGGRVPHPVHKCDECITTMTEQLGYIHHNMFVLERNCNDIISQGHIYDGSTNFHVTESLLPSMGPVLCGNLCRHSLFTAGCRQACSKVWRTSSVSSKKNNLRKRKNCAPVRIFNLNILYCCLASTCRMRGWVLYFWTIFSILNTELDDHKAFALEYTHKNIPNCSK